MNQQLKRMFFILVTLVWVVACDDALTDAADSDSSFYGDSETDTLDSSTDDTATGNSDSDSANITDSDTGRDITDDPLYDSESIFASPKQFADKIPALADFWKTPRDNVNGGYYTYVDITGNPTANTNKSVITQSRSAYGFTKAFMLTGQEEYLEYAQHALNFIYDNAWDTVNDGWYYELTETGTPTTYWANSTKWSFGQHYALLGVTAMVEATQDPYNKSWLMKGWESNETHLWDNDPVDYGYFAQADADWSNPEGKGFTPSADGITTNVLGMYIAANNSAGKTRLAKLASNMYDHFITASMDDRIKFGLAEDYHSDWTLNEDKTFGFVGHVLKTAWCLDRAHLVTGEDSSMNWVERAEELLLDVWNNGGYDHTYGGPFCSMTWDDGFIDNTQKEYWQIEQAVTAGLMTYYTSKNQNRRAIFLQMATESMQFFLDYFFDDTNGGIYLLTHPDGTLLDDTKGDIYKSAYHGIETLYYGYIYGSLFYADKPVKLYYRFLPADKDITVKLTPCSIENNVLEIFSVTKDGVAYTDFNSDTRELNVMANNGGIFKVTFRRK